MTAKSAKHAATITFSRATPSRSLLMTVDRSAVEPRLPHPSSP